MSRHFTEPHPETGEALYGCPRWSHLATMWMLDTYDARGNYIGACIARGDDLAWIKTNPGEVKVMQEKVAIWQQQFIPF